MAADYRVCKESEIEPGPFFPFSQFHLIEIDDQKLKRQILARRPIRHEIFLAVEAELVTPYPRQITHLEFTDFR